MYIYIYIYIYVFVPPAWGVSRAWLRGAHRENRQGGRYGWKPSSSSNFSIRAFRAYPLVETRYAASCRAIRGDCISGNSALPPLREAASTRAARKRLPRPPRSSSELLVAWFWGSRDGAPTARRGEAAPASVLCTVVVLNTNKTI